MTMKRYERHVLLPEIGEGGQRKLRSSTVLVVGCGGLGCTIATLLVRAGVGKLVLVDDDCVEMENIHRQILFDEEDARNGTPKVVAAAEKLKEMNSEVEVIPVVAQANPSTIEEFLKGVDVVMDGTDNLEARFLINDACVKHRIPWIHGAVTGTEGITMNIIPGTTACFRCFMHHVTYMERVRKRERAGILNTAVLAIASLQATEALKVLTGGSTRKEALHVDVWCGTWTPITVERRASCPACGRGIFEFLEE